MKKYIELLRLNKPIGIFLLFWPCAWSIAISEWYQFDLYLFIKYFFLFFIGAILMRSAGCIFNDIIDRNFDKKVSRTKNRLIASKKISIFTALIIIFLLVSSSLLILIQFNKFSIVLGISSGLLIIIYPFMKRITFWPQLFLGLVFNWGALLGWSAFFGNIKYQSIILYIAAIFWTLGYDTIYALQDLKDDLKINVKSTAIKFQKNIIKFLSICFATFTIIMIMLGVFTNRNYSYFILIILSSFHLIFQIYSLSKIKNNNKNQLHKIFSSNNFFGFIIFLILTSQVI